MVGALCSTVKRGPELPQVLRRKLMSVENPVPAPGTPEKPRRATVLLATVAALALTAGVVGGFVWSGGGPLSVAHPIQTADATPTPVASGSVAPTSAVIAPQAIPGAL